MNKHIALLCSTFALVACGDSTPTPTPDAAVTPDVTADAPAGDTPAADAPAGDATTGGCFTQESAAPVCPSTAIAQGDAMRPAFRVTHIRITAPMALTSAILQGTVNDAIHRGNFLWGITLDLGANMVRTGALNTMMITRGTVGQGLIDGTFRYYAGNAPAMGGAATRWDPVTTTTTTMSDRVTTGTLMGTVRLPIFDATGALLTELPLENAVMRNVTIAGDRKCIGAGQLSGGRFNECTSNWQTSDAMMMPYGNIEAVITAAAARGVRVSALNMTLCTLLAGSDCEAVPQAMWARQPDAMAGGMPGYRLTTEFAAISARIQ
ncbi:MAG: hypothetical protein U0324_02280 [Polyangiales bacterium]